MTTSELTSPQIRPLNNHREAALDRATNGIRSCQRSILSDMVTIGRWLRDVRKNHYYLARYRTFTEYLEREALVSESNSYKWMEWSIYWDALTEQLNEGERLPSSGAQLVALNAAPDNKRGEAWRVCYTRSEEHGWFLSARMVKAIVYETYAPTKKVYPSKAKFVINGVQNLGEARKRIAEICGDKLLRQIDVGQYQVDEKDLMNWGRLDPDRIAFVGRAMEGLGWNLNRSLVAYAEKIDLNSRVRQLVARAIAEGKSITVRANGCKITVEKEPTDSIQRTTIG